MKSTRNNQIKKEAVNQKIIFPKYLIWDGKKTLFDAGSDVFRVGNLSNIASNINES
jgi:hypothetical protein